MPYVIVTSDYCWGVGLTYDEAYRNARAAGHHPNGSGAHVSRLHDDIDVDSVGVNMMGHIRWSIPENNPEAGVMERWTRKGTGKLVPCDENWEPLKAVVSA